MKKLLTFVALFFFVSTLHATIHYFEVNDNVGSFPLYYDVDLDGDNDFFFTVSDFGSSTGSFKFHVNSSNSTSFHAAEGANDTLPKAYNNGASLGTHNWRNTKGLLYSPTTGYFNSNKYLMVKFSDGTNTYHGWFLVGGGFQAYVISYAYSDVPNEIITAGETDPTGIPELFPAFFDLETINQHHIAFKNCSEYDRVFINSLDGKLIAEIENPIAAQKYTVEGSSNILLISFFLREKLLHTRKYLVYAH
ncbi:MAG: hypothetical protein SH857_00690 [Chitinophagales bacterium]|nr:hypothetical protein [Chitinophagales bacterium]